MYPLKNYTNPINRTTQLIFDIHILNKNIGSEFEIITQTTQNDKNLSYCPKQVSIYTT